MKLKQHTSSILRIISILGIILLLTLQYLWIKNAYKTVEQTLTDQTVDCLRKAVEEEQTLRDIQRNKSVIFTDNSKPSKDQTVFGSFEVKNIDEMRYLLNDMMVNEGSPVNAFQIDSLFCLKMQAVFGSIPNHNVQIVTNNKIILNVDSLIEAIVISKKSNTIEILYRIGLEQSIKLEILSPSRSIIQKGKTFLMISILVVLLIGAILLYQYKNYKREDKFSHFIIDYTRMIAHDLQSPISSIRMVLDRLMGKNDLILKTRNEYYQMSIDESDKVLINLNNLLFIASSESNNVTIHRSLFDLELLIEHVSDRIKRMNAEYKTINIHVRMLPERFFFNLDIQLFENLLFNLMDNSVKFSNEIINIYITCTQSKKGLLLEVKDDGIGMSEDVQKRIFNLFERGNTQSGLLFSGYGIGLSFVQKVVQAHNGSIKVLSKEHLGTIFTIQIPNE